MTLLSLANCHLVKRCQGTKLRLRQHSRSIFGLARLIDLPLNLRESTTNLLEPPGTRRICLVESSLLLLPFLPSARSVCGVVFLRASLVRCLGSANQSFFSLLDQRVESVWPRYEIVALSIALTTQ
jgi:hypothetical protein